MGPGDYSGAGELLDVVEDSERSEFTRQRGEG
jgi:hypothetical protein